MGQVHIDRQVKSMKLLNTFFMKSTFFVLLCIGLAAICQGQTGQTLTEQDIANSQLFKTSSGADRTTTFQSLKQLIVAQSGNHEASPSTKFTNKAELLNILGAPDFMISPTTLGYYLREVGGACVVAIGLSPTEQVQYFSVYDCN